jgi:pteridine reductase
MRSKLEIFGTESPVALVTGSGAARVGRAIAEEFLEQGYQVVLHARRSIAIAEARLQELRASGHSVSLVSGAVEDEAAVSDWLREILEKHARIDVVVNAAAVWTPQPLEKTTSVDFEQAFRVNTLGPALVAKIFGLQMAAQSHGGAIINIGDWAVVRPYKRFAAYFVSKGAIEVLTRTMAVELSSRNPKIRVNAVLPGPVLLAEGISNDRQERILQQSLLKRLGTAMDVAEAVLFLAESPFITGVCLPVDGGRSIYAGPASDPIAHPEYNQDTD